MNRSPLVHECLEDLSEALLQDTHRPIMVVLVEVLAVRTLKHSKKSPHSIHQKMVVPNYTTCNDKHEAFKDAMAIIQVRLV